MKITRIILCILIFTFWIGCCGKIKKIHKQSIGSVPDTSYYIVLDYKFNEDDEEPFVVITGSGVAVSNPYDKISLIMTAAHVCIGDPGLAFMNPDISVKDIYGNQTSAQIQGIDMENDLCILRIEKNVSIAVIAEKRPDLLDGVYYVGYPAGLYSEGVLHKLEGNYSGVDPFGNDIWSFPATGGASGSPVYNEKSELIGIISSVHMEFPHCVMGANLSSIKHLVESVLSPQ